MDKIIELLVSNLDLIVAIVGFLTAFMAGRLKGGKYKALLVRFIEGIEAHDNPDKHKKAVKRATEAAMIEKDFNLLVKKHTKKHADKK